MRLRDRPFIKIIYRFFLYGISFNVIMISVFLLFGYLARGHKCIELKNGLNLGYNAVLDLREPFFSPYVVPKLPNGAPLFDQESWAVYVTDTTLFGRTFGNAQEAAFSYAWRSDVGLVRADDNLEKYKKLVAEAGKANDGLGRGDLGAKIVMDRMIEQNAGSYDWCVTKIVTW